MLQHMKGTAPRAVHTDRLDVCSSCRVEACIAEEQSSRQSGGGKENIPSAKIK